MFHVGDYVMKTTDGVCEIKDIMTPDFVKDSKKMYYQLLAVSDEKGVVYVPVEKADHNIRRIMSEEEAESFIQRIPDMKAVWVTSERERERNYKEIIQSNDPEKLVGIIKLLYQRQQIREEKGKKITAVDERYFAMAEKLLYSELEAAMKKDKEEIHTMIHQCCEENKLQN